MRNSCIVGKTILINQRVIYFFICQLLPHQMQFFSRVASINANRLKVNLFRLHFYKIKLKVTTVSIRFVQLKGEWKVKWCSIDRFNQKPFGRFQMKTNTLNALYKIFVINLKIIWTCTSNYYIDSQYSSRRLSSVSISLVSTNSSKIKVTIQIASGRGHEFG